MRKFKQHFPHLFSKFLKENESNTKWKNNINWYATFRDAHNDEYQDSDKKIEKIKKRLFPLVKEGDRTGLKKEKLKLDDLELKDKNGITLLEWAQQQNQQAILDLFFKRIKKTTYLSKHKKLIPTKIDKYGHTILYWAILCRQLPDKFKSLIEDGCDPKVTTQLDLLHRLIPVKLSQSDDIGYTLLHHAAQEGRAEIAELLIVDYGIKVNTQGSAGITPLLPATINGHKNIVDILLAYGASVNILGDSNKTLLMFAAEEGQAEIAEILLSHGAKVDAQTHAGATALLYAVEKGHANVVDVLLRYNANTSLALQTSTRYHKPIVAGDTPLEAAFKLRHKSIIDALLTHGTSANILFDSNKTLLMFAAEEGQAEIVEILLSHGAKIDAQTHAGATALLYAVEKGHADVVGVLLRYNANTSLALQTSTRYEFVS